MTLRIIEHADGHYELYDGPVQVGRVLGRTLSYHGLESRSAARRAASAAYDALLRWAARQRRAEPAPRRARLLELKERAGGHALATGGQEVGRLLAPGDSEYADGSHGFELTLPAHWGSALSAAQVVHHTLVGRLAIPAADA